MINGKQKLFERINQYQFENPSELNYGEKVNQLEKAVENSLRESSVINLAFSGGVDSSLILVKALSLFPQQEITAFTVARKCKYPDIEYSKKFVKELQEKGYNLKQNVHLTDVSSQDILKSNEILETDSKLVDNYYMLMKILAKHNVKKVLGGDIIDELMGGYYAHSKNPNLTIFRKFMSRLIPEHLDILDKMSSHFGIEVFLPYGSERVMKCSSEFKVGELVKNRKRKIPVYDLAKRNGVSQEVLERRKYGLVSAFD